jgi:hypothetical protein
MEGKAGSCSTVLGTRFPSSLINLPFVHPAISIDKMITTGNILLIFIIFLFKFYAKKIFAGNNCCRLYDGKWVLTKHNKIGTIVAPQTEEGDDFNQLCSKFKHEKNIINCHRNFIHGTFCKCTKVGDI